LDLNGIFNSKNHPVYWWRFGKLKFSVKLLKSRSLPDCIGVFLPLRSYQAKKCPGSVRKPVKPTWSDKMTVLSTFLESSVNFLSKTIKKQ